MVNCAQYCMFISAPGCIFMIYLGFLISIGSETIYITPKSRMESAFALFIAALIYAIFFGISYNSEYSQIQRNNNLQQWINDQDIKEMELEEYHRPQPEIKKELIQQVENNKEDI